MHWLFLGLAIVLEVAGTISMKLSQGFTKPLPSIGVAVFYIACFSFLTLALKKIEMSLAYATWAGVGTALIAVAGIVIFHEGVNALKIVSLVLIVLGVIGLNLSGGAH